MTRLLLTCALLLSLTGAGDAACPPVKRSAAVLKAFRKTHPCPSTNKTTGACPGWILDHGTPLCLTGPQGDVSWNLFWADVYSAKQKDRLEKNLCRKLCACQESHTTVMPK